jgi:predicted membrane channel-forming protein YqfA (hemolysin III family)
VLDSLLVNSASYIGIVVAIICSVVAMKQAEKKGYNKWAFAALGFFCGLIGLVISLVVKDKNKA